MNRAWHAETWSEAERDAYFRERLRQWAAFWRERRAEIVEWRAHDRASCREFFRHAVKDLLYERRRALYRPRYTVCNCGCRAIPERLYDELGYLHYPRGEAPEPSDEEVAAWVADDPWRRQPGGVAKAMAEIERCRPGGPVVRRHIWNRPPLSG